MAKIRPFKALRPEKKYAAKVSCLPYDVVSEAGARKIAGENPLSFMRVIRPEVNFPEGYEFKEGEVYEKAASILDDLISEGIFKEEKKPCYYIYRQLTMGRIQTGLVGCFAVDDYLNGNIKEHEATRLDKEEDRIRHIDACNANTGLVYLAYKKGRKLRSLLEKETSKTPLYDLYTDDGVRHLVWKISDKAKVREFSKAACQTGKLYIADGHHRAASAAKVCLKRRAEDPAYTGDEEFNYFMGVAFPKQELVIMPYDRVVKDLNGLSTQEFLLKISEKFSVSEVSEEFTKSERAAGAFKSARKGEIAMYLDKKWYRLNFKGEIAQTDPVKVLDVNILQENILGPVLGILDPRSDERIDFVGGSRAIPELERRCSEDMKAAFALYPTSMDELMNVADSGLYMPPKSTWFEPKLQSGLFIHRI